jgi:aminoglycoside phosphotransferase (APT) family kinase protein
VKQALTDDAASWLQTERLVYENVRAAFVPGYLGSLDDVLVLEDLTSAQTAPPWPADRIEAVLAILAEVRATEAPAGLPRLDDMRERLVGWPAVHEDPAPLLSTGLCTAEWLDAALPSLLDAVDGAELDGADLVHADVRSDNLFFKESHAVLVDWNIACVGNGRFDVVFWLPSLRLEGGPQPWEVMPDAGALAAVAAGFFAARAGLPPPAGAPTVREFQRRQAEVALRWAARELRLSAVG